MIEMPIFRSCSFTHLYVVLLSAHSYYLISINFDLSTLAVFCRELHVLYFFV